MKKKGLPGPLFMDAVALELAIQEFARGEVQNLCKVRRKCEELKRERSRTQMLLADQPIGTNAAIWQGEAMIEKVGLEF